MAALLLAVVAILFFVPDVSEGNVLQQHDTVQGIANGQEGKAFTEATGETTRWTDSLFGGMPNFQIAPSYPANNLLEWINRVYTLFLPSPAGLLFAMMLGFFIMGLCFRLKWQAALFGAVAWGFSSYFIIIIGAGHIWKFITLSYIPPTIGAIYLCYRGKRLAGAALTALFGALQLQGNHPQMTYYFLFVVLFMMIAWLVGAIKKHEVGKWGVSTLCALAGGLLALGANSASLYNSYEYSKETVRGKATEIVKKGEAPAPGMDYDAITAWSYGVDETLTLLIPNVKGGATIKPMGGQNALLSVADTDAVQNSYLSPEEVQFVSQFSQYFGNQPMTNGPVYVGAFVLLLAVLALFVVDDPKWVPMKWALFAAMIFSLVLAWGDNLAPVTRFFIEYFPFYNKFRAVASMLVVLEFCVPFLAVLCVMKIADTPDFLKRYGYTAACVTGVFVLICLVGAVSPGAFGSPFTSQEREYFAANGLTGDPAYSGVLAAISDARLSLVRADSLRSLGFIVLGTLIAFMYARGIVKNRNFLFLSLTAVVLIDLFTVNHRYVNHDNFVAPAESQSELAMTPADEEILKDKGNYRVLDADNFSGARSSYFHKTIGGYHAAKLTRYNDLLEHQIMPALQQKKDNMQVINMLNAKYFIAGGKVVPNPDAFGNAWFAQRVDYVPDANAEMNALDTLDLRTAAVADARFKDVIGAGSAKQPGDTIYETSYAPNRLNYKYKSAGEGVAVFSEIFFPWGWSATVDGKPVEIGRVNYVLRAIRVPAGEHQIEFRFDPQSLKVTNVIAVTCVVITFLLCAAAIAFFFLKKRKK